MRTTGDERADLLARARERWTAGDSRGVVAVLEGLDTADLVAEPETGFLLAAALRRTGEGRRAFDVVRGIAAACERRGRDALWLRRLNLEAALHLERGATAEAELAWQRIIEAATPVGDQDMLSKASNNLGIVYTLQGRWEDALASYGRALAACRRSGDRRGLAQAHQNIAISYRELGFWREADAHFGSAFETAVMIDAEDVAGRVEEERALMFLLREDPRLAAVSAGRALERFVRTGDRAGEGEALRVLGLIALAADRLDEARVMLQRALVAASEAAGPLLEAETEIALAAVERAAGETAPADEHSANATRIFQAIGATTWGERTAERIAQLAARRRTDTS